MENFDYFFILTFIPATFGIFLAHMKHRHFRYMWLTLSWIANIFILGIIHLLMPKIGYFYFFLAFVMCAYYVCISPVDRILRENEKPKNRLEGVIYGAYLLTASIYSLAVIQDMEFIDYHVFAFILISCILIIFYGSFSAVESIKNTKISKQQNEKSNETSSILNEINWLEIQAPIFSAKIRKMELWKLNFNWILDVMLITLFLYGLLDFIGFPLFLFLSIFIFSFSLIQSGIFKEKFLVLQNNYLIVWQKTYFRKIYTSDIKGIKIKKSGIFLQLNCKENWFIMGNGGNELKGIVEIEDIYTEKIDVIYENLMKWYFSCGIKNGC